LFWMTRTALELIGQSGLGYSFDPLTEDGVPHPYSTASPAPSLSSFYSFAHIYEPDSQARRSKADAVHDKRHPNKPRHQVRDMVDIVYNTSIEILESKKRALAGGDEAVARQIGQGKDIISILNFQERHREEILEDREKHGDLAYDELVSLPYLDSI